MECEYALESDVRITPEKQINYLLVLGLFVVRFNFALQISTNNHGDYISSGPSWIIVYGTNLETCGYTLYYVHNSYWL
ncbi:hypothetical protein D3C71_1679950 [compost metagenome]